MAEQVDFWTLTWEETVGPRGTNFSPGAPRVDKSQIMDQLQFQEAQKKELAAAERGEEELPKILGSSYEKRVAEGELKRFSERDEWYKNEWFEQIFWWHRNE